MNLLHELPIGNAFKSSNEIAFRCKGDISPDYIPIIPIKQYFLINKELEVHPLSLVSDFESGMMYKDTVQIKVIPVGTVAWTKNPLGLNQLILITDIIKDNIMMVASLDEPKLISAMTRIVDLGPIARYAGPNVSFSQLRICPNCGNISLKTNPDLDDDGIMKILGVCYNCNCKVQITW